jgi:hypothetical protein
MYLINLGLLVPQIGVIALQLIFRANDVSTEYPYHCTVGMELAASAVSLCYDVLLSVLYMSIFIKYYCFPNAIQQTAHQSTSLHMMAMRNIIATVVTFFASCANYLLMIFLQGRERGLVASSCTSLVRLVFLFNIYLFTKKKKCIHLVCYCCLCGDSLGHNTSC